MGTFNTVIVYAIAIFFLVGIFDRVFLRGRLGFSAELEKGISQVAGLIMSLVGIMCFAPLLGKILTPIVSPLYNLIGADPANFPGIILGPDGGAFALAQSMTEDNKVIALSGLFLASMLGVTICFSLPFALGIVDEEDKDVLSKGMLAGIIASPFGAVISGLIAGFPITFIIKNLSITFVIVILIVIALIKAQDALVKGFALFSKGISALATLSLGFACFEMLTGIKLIPGLDSIGDKFQMVGSMGITIGGALCMILFLQKILKKAFLALGKLLKVNDVAVMGIILSTANAMPVYSMIKDMDQRGKLFAVAFSVPACYSLGAHLAYTATVMPEYILPEVLGKIICGILAIIIAQCVFVRGNQEEWNK
ncbi:MAG: ethanolamine utilization protein EutH [Eubacteriales bacterium]|nr:ethanolamine utilization protein EutH [Eubacteriales bacterium]